MIVESTIYSIKSVCLMINQCRVKNATTVIEDGKETIRGWGRQFVEWIGPFFLVWKD